MAKLVCPDCGKEVKSKSALTAHIRKEHKDDPTVELAAKFGSAAPRPGGAWKPDRPLRAVPSGVPSIDYAIGIGGVPRGTLVEIFGDPAAGKTFTALTFGAFAQQQGGRLGFVDAERALQPSFLKLVPGLDVDAMFYAQPSWGEEAMEMSKEYIKTGQFAVWIIDSVHACVPKQMADTEIGSSQAQAALARLMSQSCQVLEHVIADTDTVAIFLNHKKHKPGVKFGRDWYVPGGSALEFYGSLRLHVWAKDTYKDKSSGKRIGHKVRVKVEKSKVSAPYATADYDLFYQAGVRSDTNEPVEPGIDVTSCWLSVLEAEERIKWSGNGYVDTDTGEKLGSVLEVREMLTDATSPLLVAANELVYPPEFAAA